MLKKSVTTKLGQALKYFSKGSVLKFLNSKIRYAMKNILALFLLLTCTLMGTKGYANNCCRDQQQFYAGITGGTSFVSSSLSGAKFKPGFYVGGAFGYTCTNPFRLEAELLYQRQELDHARGGHHGKGHLNTWQGMANVLFECPLFCNFKVYLGGGAGYACARGKWTSQYSFLGSVHHKKNGFAWQAILGLTYPICQHTDLSVEYRYFDVDSHVTNHKFGLAIRQYF